MTATADKEMLDTIVEALQDRKGKSITLIDLTQLQVSNALHFVIATGNTPTQVAALADSVRETLHERLGIKPLNYTGYNNSIWIVIDYGHIMVHIFVPDARAYYDIEQLWADGVTTCVPDID